MTSWSIDNKTIKSLTRNNKTIKSIVDSNNTEIYSGKTVLTYPMTSANSDWTNKLVEFSETGAYGDGGENLRLEKTLNYPITIEFTIYKPSRYGGLWIGLYAPNNNNKGVRAFWGEGTEYVELQYGDVSISSNNYAYWGYNGDG